MKQLGVKKEDIVEKFIRSCGPGGQNVNKVSTCVYLKHLPTGIEVKSQSKRLQSQNRIYAYQLLLEKIQNRIENSVKKEWQLKQKNLRRNRPKPRTVKLRILEQKHRQSRKKQLRAKKFDF
jgi:protein subunit release factor B